MFGFKEIEHKKYKNNFLKTVVFQVDFDKCINLKEHDSKIEKLFKINFPRFNSAQGKGFEISLNNENPNFQQINDGHTINLKSENGQRVIKVTEKSLSFTIGGSSYSYFDNLIDDFNCIISFLELCKIDTVNRLAIRKINLVEFKNNENPSDILKFLLNPNIVSQIDDFPNRQLVNHSIQSINYKDENNFLNIKYGLNIPPQLNSEVGHLIIDIDLFKQEKIKIKDIIKNSKSINSEIFNIFSWLINDNTKKILNE